MPKFIVEVGDGMESYELSDDTGKYELIATDVAYESAIHEALRDYGFDSIKVKFLSEESMTNKQPKTITPPAEGEVAELARWLRLRNPIDMEGEPDDCTYFKLTRAAELLERHGGVSDGASLV